MVLVQNHISLERGLVAAEHSAVFSEAFGSWSISLRDIELVVPLEMDRSKKMRKQPRNVCGEILVQTK